MLRAHYNDDAISELPYSAAAWKLRPPKGSIPSPPLLFSSLSPSFPPPFLSLFPLSFPLSFSPSLPPSYPTPSPPLLLSALFAIFFLLRISNFLFFLPFNLLHPPPLPTRNPCSSMRVCIYNHQSRFLTSSLCIIHTYHTVSRYVMLCCVIVVDDKDGVERAWPDSDGFRYFLILQMGLNSSNNDCFFIGK